MLIFLKAIGVKIKILVSIQTAFSKQLLGLNIFCSFLQKVFSGFFNEKK
jgi:hypothetical protein